jgi:hypothetical protein
LPQGGRRRQYRQHKQLAPLHGHASLPRFARLITVRTLLMLYTKTRNGVRPPSPKAILPVEQVNPCAFARIAAVRLGATSIRRLGLDMEFLSPDGFPTFPLPTYPGLRLAIPGRRHIARRIDQARPDASHIATEGPIGYRTRAYCEDVPEGAVHDRLVAQ